MDRATPHATRNRAAALLVAAALLLAGCLLSPGRFVSALDIRKDGRFSLTYAGEIHMLALSKLAQMGAQAETEFAPSPCLTDDGSGEPRECSADEIASQRDAWQAGRERKAREAEQMKSFLGGIDPTDPKAAEEFAQRLRRQAGWRKVDYKGDGLFEVDFALSGTLSHDLVFPTIERFPLANAFVTVAVRNDGTVRVDAPGFGPAAGGEPYRGLMQMAAMSNENGSGDKGAGAPRMPLPEGAFTLRTDGEILANNTDEGAVADTTGRALSWKIGLREGSAAPMALIRLRN